MPAFDDSDVAFDDPSVWFDGQLLTIDSNGIGVYIVGDFTQSQLDELNAWSGALSTEPSWLRRTATFYWNGNDPAAQLAYLESNSVINLAIIEQYKDYIITPRRVATYRAKTTVEIEDPTVPPGTILQTIDAPGLGLAWDGSHLWQWSSDIHKIDPTTGNVLDTESAPGLHIWKLTYGDGKLWAVDIGWVQVYVIDPADGSELDSFAIPTVSNPSYHGIAYTDSGLWFLNDTEDAIQLIDADTQSEITVKFLPPGNRHGLAWDGQYLWTTDIGNATVCKIDPSDGSILEAIPTDATDAAGGDLEWDGTHLWLTQEASPNSYIHRINVVEE